MLIADFNTDFQEYINDGDIIGANDVIMAKLGSILVNHKQHFIDLLNESGVEADISMPNSQLIELYMENVDNRHLLLGSSLLANMEKSVACDNCTWAWLSIDDAPNSKICRKCGNDNTKSSFNSSDILSDENVKTAYIVLNENFNDDETEDDYSNVLGLLAAAAAKAGVKALRKNKKNKGSSSSDDLKLRAQLKLQQAAIAQQKALLQNQKLQLEKAKKQKTTIIIIGSSLLVLMLAIVVVVKTKKQ